MAHSTFQDEVILTSQDRNGIAPYLAPAILQATREGNYRAVGAMLTACPKLAFTSIAFALPRIGWEPQEESLCPLAEAAKAWGHNRLALDIEQFHTSDPATRVWRNPEDRHLVSREITQFKHRSTQKYVPGETPSRSFQPGREKRHRVHHHM
jgi:hypothetical protein